MRDKARKANEAAAMDKTEAEATFKTHGTSFFCKKKVCDRYVAGLGFAVFQLYLSR